MARAKIPPNLPGKFYVISNKGNNKHVETSEKEQQGEFSKINVNHYLLGIKWIFLPYHFSLIMLLWESAKIATKFAEISSRFVMQK